MPTRLNLYLIVMAMCTGSALAGKEAATTSPSSPATRPKPTLIAPAAKGQTIFVGWSPLAKQGPTTQPGLHPLWYNQISPKSQGSDWEIRFTLARHGEDQQWDWTMSLRCKYNGIPTERVTTRGKPLTIVGEHVEPLKIKKIDESDEVGIAGLRVYRFPYARMGEKTAYVVVAIADDPKLFTKDAELHVSKDFFIYSWNDPLEIK